MSNYTPQPNEALRDPFQGFDIQVAVTDAEGKSDGVLGGAFTGFMCRIVNQTEAYLTIGRRVPRMLDGEIIIGWSLEQGMVGNRPITETYGKEFAEAYKNGRLEDLPRQRRFHIEMETTIASIPGAPSEVHFRHDLPLAKLKMNLTIRFARVDTGSFGMVAGKRVASSSWQGTGQSVEVKPAA